MLMGETTQRAEVEVEAAVVAAVAAAAAVVVVVVETVTHRTRGGKS